MSSDIEVISDVEIDIGEDANQENTEDAAKENSEEVQRDETADEENNVGSQKQTVKPKRVVRNPQPKLNEETLKGPRGIAALQSYFDRVKFKGKGYEHQDLNTIMKTYEYWCHRLFPKFPFDTCIERLDKLGFKKAVQTHIKRIRFDLFVEDKPIIDSSDEETNLGEFVNIDSEQIEHQNKQFDELFVPPLTSVIQQPVELTDIQLERMKLNQERAEKIRQEKQRKISDKSGVNLDISSIVPGTSNLDNKAEDKEVSQNLGSDISNSLCGCVQFDLESNVKGKSSVSGNAKSKKSNKMHETLDCNETASEINSIIVKENNTLSHSELEGDNKDLNKNNGIISNSDNNPKPSNTKRGREIILDSDNSDLDETARENFDKRRKIKTKVQTVLDTDESDEERSNFNATHNNTTDKNSKYFNTNSPTYQIHNDNEEPMNISEQRIDTISEINEPGKFFDENDTINENKENALFVNNIP